MDCLDCNGHGYIIDDFGEAVACLSCDGTGYFGGLDDEG